MNKKLLVILLSFTMTASLLMSCKTPSASETEKKGATSIPETETVQAPPEMPAASIVEIPSAEETSNVESTDGDETDGFTWGEYTAELPLSEDGIVFTYWMTSQPFMMTYGGSLDYNTLPFYEAMEALTGVHLDLTVHSMQSSQEQFNLMFATGDYPDMFEGEYTSGAGQGIEDDVIVPLNDYLSEYMPNYSAWLDYNAAARAVVTTDAGDIYCAANIYINNSGQIQGPMLRGDWLEDAAMELPTTYDELHDVLAAFQEAGHPNAFWMTSALQVPFYAWSAGYDVINETFVRDGQVMYGPITDEYRDYVTMLHQWYKEGLIYKDFVTVSQQADSIDTGLVLDGTVGVWVGDTTRMETLEAEGGLTISAFTYPTRNTGEQVHMCQNEDIIGQSTTISTHCAEPEIACQYLDYLYTYDGYILSNYGEEGVAFEYDKEGIPQLTDLVIHNPEFITPVGFILYTKFSGAGICDNRRSTLAYTERNFNDIALWATNIDNDHLLPKDTILNTEEGNASSTIINDVETYVQENLLRFVVGDLSLTQWDTYVADIKAMGIDTAVQIYQGAYVCDKRLDQRLAQVSRSKKNQHSLEALENLQSQLDLDETVHLSDYDRRLVCVPDFCNCKRKHCRYKEYIKQCASKQYLFQVCNHNLLFADAIHRDTGKRPIFPEPCALVLDESHKVPEVAREMFGVTLCKEDLQAVIYDLHSAGYILAAEYLADATKPLQSKLAIPPEDEPFSTYAERLRIPYQVLQTVNQKLCPQLTHLLRRNLQTVTMTIRTLLQYESEENIVCFVSRDENGGTKLCATVYDLTGPMKKIIWSKPQGMILTSGTLAVGKDFHRFREETGLVHNGRVVESVSESPFDYKENTLLYLPQYPPVQFGDKISYYYDALAGEISRLIDAASGHCLVLFTSYAAMSAIKERLLELNLLFPLFALDSNNPSHTVKRFKEQPGAVLLATGAAWEGMDFPGDCVSLLVIPKLPFAFPDELREKQKEQYDSFHDFIQAIIIPEMQIKLRQGFGRAIRTETDTCVVAILDDRAGRNGRYYGAMLEALPELRCTSDLADVTKFMLEKKPDQYFKEPGNA